jgi:hypothetical protein
VKAGLVVAIAALFPLAAVSAQTVAIPQGEALTSTIIAEDAKLFAAYNACDTDTMAAMVSEDLEFYHDQSGLAVGRTPFVAAIKNNICGKVRRDLVPGTLEVYPLKDYGAVETGEHVFCDPKKFTRCDPAKAGVAKFVMLWRLQDGAWQLTRVISYNHVNDWQRKPAR